MDEATLIGYVLGLLEEEERQVVEAQLAASPQWRAQLRALEQWLRLLAEPDDDPPADLHFRTLRLVAEKAVEARRSAQNGPSSALGHNESEPAGSAANLPDVYPLGREVHVATSSPRWRLTELVLLMLLALVVGGLIPPAILQARHAQQVLACQQNLRKFHACLCGYAQQNDERLPALQEEGPLAHAGVFVLLLRDSCSWDEDLSVICPANRKPDAEQRRDWPSLQHWRSWHEAPDPDCRNKYHEWCRRLSGCYAYHLGYRDDQGRLCGLTLRDQGCLPILADRPPRCDEEPHWLVKNSPNHAGLGQNVLYLGGNVKFQRWRSCNHFDEDIYTNRHRKLAAGCDLRDAVLGPSEATPKGLTLVRQHSSPPW